MPRGTSAGGGATFGAIGARPTTTCARAPRASTCAGAPAARQAWKRPSSRACARSRAWKLPGRGYMNSYADYERVLPVAVRPRPGARAHPPILDTQKPRARFARSRARARHGRAARARRAGVLRSLHAAVRGLQGHAHLGTRLHKIAKDVRVRDGVSALAAQPRHRVRPCPCSGASILPRFTTSNTNTSSQLQRCKEDPQDPPEAGANVFIRHVCPIKSHLGQSSFGPRSFGPRSGRFHGVEKF